MLLLQPGDQLQDLRFHGDVQSRGRLIGDEQPRLCGERDRDEGALPHAPRKLMGKLLVPSLRRAHPHLGQELGRPVLHAGARQRRVVAEVLGDLKADGVDGIQGAQRILKDQGDLPAPQSAHVSAKRLQGGDIDLLACSRRVVDGAADDACGPGRQ